MGESTRHREAFDLYFNLGAARTIERLRSELESTAGKAPSIRTLYEWSRRFNWQYRLETLERKAREAMDESRVIAIQDMNERQAREGLLLQQKGALRLAEISADDMNARDAIRAVTEGSRLERLALGEVTERTESTISDDSILGGMSDDELEGILRHIQQGVPGTGKKRAD